MSDWKAKRFWTEVSVVDLGGGFEIALDGRTVKTPLKNPLIVPTRAMAEVIAAEWDAQEGAIDPLTMPATRAANSAIEKVTPQRSDVISMLAEYGESDLLCYRAAQPEALIARQAAAWDPLLDWAAETLGARLTIAAGVMFVAQPAKALAALRAPLEQADAYELAALHDLVMLSGSLVIGLKATQDKDPKPLWAASRVDETFQAEEWGYDEEAAEMAQGKADGFFAAHRFYQLARNEK